MHTSSSSSLTRRLGGAVVLVLLGLPLLLAIAQLLHGRALVWGEGLWPGYAQLRQRCEVSAGAALGADPDVAAEDAGTASGPGATQAAGGAPTNAATAGAPNAADDALIDDLLVADDPVPAPGPASAASAPAANPTATTGAPPGDAAGVSEGEADDLLEGLDAAAAKASAATAAPPPPPSSGHAGVGAVPAPPPLTAGQQRYCRAERIVGDINQIGVAWMPVLMALLLVVAAIIASLRRHHIALRTPHNTGEDRVANIAQILANLVIAYSAWHSLAITTGSNYTLQQVWIAGGLAMAAIHGVWLLRPVRGEGPTRPAKAIAAIPLYAWMALISAAWFLGFEDHPAGLSIYLQKITEYAILYVQVGLYLWAGMLLRDTSVGQLVFDLVRPLRLPPELFAVVVVVAAALPTAYSGASGILVLALGATMFTELRRSGLSLQRAMAATAMSGSLGVVLPPCLLVVIVASLNLDVTTDELFHWGWRVFGVSIAVFAAVSYVTRSAPWRVGWDASSAGALAAAARRLVPYLLIGGAVVLAFRYVLDAPLDEHTAPYVLPVALMALVPWDRRRNRAAARDGDGPVDLSGLTRATSLDAGTHIGALLMLMGLSACLGGVIERSEVIELFPHNLGSPYVAMAVLTAVLVVIGMIMDPYGAVILVSVTLYPIAKLNGIHPLNFWMVALVSFELGYLTPPVALNQLLTRQVVEETDAFDEAELENVQGSFYARHERVIVPAAVMAVTLLVVAFLPLLWGARA